MHQLKIENITKRYGKRTVVEDLSFTVEAGRVTGFLGPNGAGKSTTMKILLDLAAAEHGHTTIGGARYRDLRDPTRTVGALLEHAYHPGRSGRNHLRILADGSGIPSSRVDEMLNLVGLADAADRRAGAYSLGMRQRLGLAAALLGDPPVLVLDEPGNGLDPQGIRDLRDLLRARAAAGGTVFVSSHLLSEVEHLADEVVVLNNGRLVTTGLLSDLQETAIAVRTPSPDRLTQVIEASGGTVKSTTERELLVRGLTIEQIGDRACAAGIALHELAPQVGSLEDLFLQWTGDSGRHETARASDKRDKKEKEVVQR
jgi:ABC-2 type transport system ATP-binding protein